MVNHLEEDDDPESEINESRRNLMKAGAVASTGALGSLAGCMGGGGNGGGGGGGNGSGSQESVTIDYWAGFPAETNSIGAYWTEGMKRFQEQNSNINVNLNSIAWGQLSQKYVTTMQGGANPPDLATTGAYALPFFQNDEIENLGPYMEEDQDLPDNWIEPMAQAAQFRGEWWAAGRHSASTTAYTLNTQLFKEHTSVENPDEDLQTWTDLRRALDEMNESTASDVYPYEVTGTPNDVEEYWGNAYTSYQGGTDPWIDINDEGSVEDPYIKPGQEPRTDGMIKNNIDIGANYSSPKHPSRGNEGAIPLFIENKIGVYPYGVSTRAFNEVDPEFSYGWGEDDNAYVIPNVRLDANYGNEFNIPELADKEGMRGGHTWGLEGQHTITQTDDQRKKDAAWNLIKYVVTSQDFLIPLLIDPSLNRNVPSYQPLIDEFKKSEYDEYKDQAYETRMSILDEYGENCMVTGAGWGQTNISGMRWDATGQTMANAYAGQITPDEAPSAMATALEERMND